VCQSCRQCVKVLQISEVQTESFCRTCGDDTEWIRKEPQCDSPDVHSDDPLVRLQIGGETFCCPARILLQAEPESIFPAMLDDVRDGCIVIDRPAKWFPHLLEYCHHGSLMGNFSHSDLDELEEEAEFCGMQNLLQCIEGLRSTLLQKGRERERREERERRQRVSALREALSSAEEALCHQHLVASLIESVPRPEISQEPRQRCGPEEKKLVEEVFERDVQICQVVHTTLGEAIKGVQRSGAMLIALSRGESPAPPTVHAGLRPLPTRALGAKRFIPTSVDPEDLRAHLTRQHPGQAPSAVPAVHTCADPLFVAPPPPSAPHAPSGVPRSGFTSDPPRELSAFRGFRPVEPGRNADIDEGSRVLCPRGFRPVESSSRGSGMEEGSRLLTIRKPTVQKGLSMAELFGPNKSAPIASGGAHDGWLPADIDEMSGTNTSVSQQRSDRQDPSVVKLEAELSEAKRRISQLQAERDALSQQLAAV